MKYTQPMLLSVYQSVTSYTEVWIEITILAINTLSAKVSPPIRRCGLKFNLVPKLISVSFCHLLYGGVDWNWLISCIYNCRYKSPPIRRCGLKYLSYQPKLHKPFVTSNTEPSLFDFYDQLNKNYKSLYLLNQTRSMIYL